MLSTKRTLIYYYIATWFGSRKQNVDGLIFLRNDKMISRIGFSLKN